MATAAVQSASGVAAWLSHARFGLATALIWAGLHFVVGGILTPHGVQRPAVVAAAPFYGLLPGVLLIGLLWVGGAIATLVVGAGNQRHVLMVLGLGLALWAAEGGQQGVTMDSWLILRNETPGPPARAPYWLLLADYAYLLLGIAGAYCITRRLGRASLRPAPLTMDKTAEADSGPLSARSVTSAATLPGLLTVLIATLVAGVAVFVLTGPALAETRRGQVYFAVLVGCLAGTAAADRLTKVRDPLWYWPVPFIVGIIGLVVAGVSPGLRLPPEYQNVNTIPAWGLARALPVEMIGVGLLGIAWLLPASPTAAKPAEGS